MHPQSDPRISYDIHAIVINQLASEHCYNELNAFSRTCRILLHPCRIHLFSTVSIDTSNAPRFVTLLKENSTIANYIEKLTYVSPGGSMSKDLANIFILLNNIKALNFNGYYEGNDWKLLSPHSQHAFAHLFSSPSLTRFYVHGFDDFPAILLSRCSTLQHLTISACHLSSSVACDNILGAPPQLLSLDLSHDCLSGPGTVMEELLQMTRASGLPILDFSGLRSLAVCVRDNRQEENFESLLRLTPKLDYMQCIVSHGISPDSWAQKLSIVLPTLHSLRLTCGSYSTVIDTAFPGPIKILEALTYRTNCINELFLSIRGSDALLDVDWEVLDHVLADRSGFPRLEKVTIQLLYIARHYGLREFQARLKKYLKWDDNGG